MVAVMSRSCDTTAYDDDDGNDNEHVYDVNTLAQLKIGSAAATACPSISNTGCDKPPGRTHALCNAGHCPV